MCGGLGAILGDLPQNLALQSSPKVKITQQAVCNSVFKQLDHPTCSRDITYSNYNTLQNLKNLLGGVGNPNNV